MSNNIIQLFLKAVEQHQNNIAFISDENNTTYQQLLTKVQATATSFHYKGITKGSKVMVFVPLSEALYVVVLALLYMGAIPVFLDEWVSLKRLKVCLQTVPCNAMVTSGKIRLLGYFIAPLRKLKKLSPTPTPVQVPLILPTAVALDDTALVTFTTGSTGTPKAANRTHLFLAAQYDALHPLLGSDHKVSLTLLPIVILLNLCLGKTNVLPTGKLQLQKSGTAHLLLLLMQKHRIEMLVASPAITVAIAKAAMQHPEKESSLNQIITGGGPVLPDDAATIVHAFSKADSVVVYGSTEAEPISVLSMQLLARTTNETMMLKGLPVGTLHASASVAIIPFINETIPNTAEANFLQMQEPAGTSGELVVSGPHVLQAYLNNEEAQQRNKFFAGSNLWHRTGDEALLDEQNRLFFLGRCTEVIIWNQKKIYPLLAIWQLKQQVPVKEAALLVVHNVVTVVIQTADKALQPQIISYLQGTDLQEANILSIRKIPKDKRHQTKIDYEKLKRKLK